MENKEKYNTELKERYYKQKSNSHADNINNNNNNNNDHNNNNNNNARENNNTNNSNNDNENRKDDLDEIKLNSHAHNSMFFPFILVECINQLSIILLRSENVP